MDNYIVLVTAVLYCIHTYISLECCEVPLQFPVHFLHYTLLVYRDEILLHCKFQSKLEPALALVGRRYTIYSYVGMGEGLPLHHI